MLDFLHPNFFALGSAFLIATARIFYQKSLGLINPTLVVLIANIISFFFATGMFLFQDSFEHWPLKGILWFLLVGVFGSLLGRYLGLLSQRLIGASRSSIWMQTVLIWSSILAVFFLNESIDLREAFGICLIMVGGILLVMDKNERKRNVSLIYYSVPILSALSFAVTFVFRRYGFEYIPSSTFGMSVSYFVATLIMGSIFITNKIEIAPYENNRGAFKNAFFGSVFNALASFCFWIAVQNGKVVEVVPIGRLSVLIVILFSWFFLRRQELITLYVVLGGILSVMGAFFIAS
tara:strand:- start:32532 stop:33407 length:876 start_codon:yes stop_codon:yes gene_type:complete